MKNGVIHPAEGCVVGTSVANGDKCVIEGENRDKTAKQV